MSPALVAIVLAIAAGAVLAVSTHDGAASAIGLAVALVGSALLTDPLPSAGVLGVRVVGALLVATLIRSAMRSGPRQASPFGWPSEALLATAGAVAGLGLAVGLATVAAAGGVPAPVPGVGEPAPGVPDAGSGVVTSMALITAAGTCLLVLGVAPLVHGRPGPRRAIGLVLVTQAMLLLRIGVAGPALELEEIAREALLVVAGATGAALARAESSPLPEREEVDGGEGRDELDAQGEGRRGAVAPLTRG
jgi:hypothetical protein